MFQLNPEKFFIISGPCVAESQKVCFEVAETLAGIREDLGVQVIFKASYIKANRSSKGSYRGPGMKEGLKLLESVKKKFNLPLLTDIHETTEVKPVSKVVDVLQIPAFLSRQTALLEEAAKTKNWVNIKKGQFLAPWDMNNVVEKVMAEGNKKVLVTERGSCFGYNNLVVDYRGVILMLRAKHHVVFDATHSVQLPSAQGKTSGGDRTLAPHMAYAAAAVGVKGFFFETHPNPEKALSDGPNSVYLKDMKNIIQKLKRITEV